MRRRFTLGEAMVVVALLCLATVAGLRWTWEDEETMARATIIMFRTSVNISDDQIDNELIYWVDERGIIAPDGTQVDR